MKRLLALALGLVFLPHPLAAQEQALGDADILALADRQAVWCENWSDTTRDCESLYTLRREPDGGLVLAGMFLMTDRPALLVTMAETVTLENGRLCGTGSTDDLNIRATLAGVPSPEATQVVRAMLAEGMAEYAEARICQQFFSDGDPDHMGEIVTADDQRLYDFESVYRLGTATSGFLLRPQVEDEPAHETIDL